MLFSSSVWVLGGWVVGTSKWTISGFAQGLFSLLPPLMIARLLITLPIDSFRRKRPSDLLSTLRQELFGRVSGLVVDRRSTGVRASRVI